MKCTGPIASAIAVGGFVLCATPGVAGDGAPTRLEFRESGFLGPSDLVLYDASVRPSYLIERVVPPRGGSGGAAADKRFTVSAASWARLRQELDAMRAWTWRDGCIDPRARDGTQWRLEIVYPDRRIAISGSNAFPTASGGCLRGLHRSDEYRRLKAILRRIADD